MADKLFRMLFKDRLKQHQENIEEKNCRGDREYWALPTTIEKLILSVWVLKKNCLTCQTICQEQINFDIFFFKRTIVLTVQEEVICHLS